MSGTLPVNEKLVGIVVVNAGVGGGSAAAALSPPEIDQ